MTATPKPRPPDSRPTPEQLAAWLAQCNGAERLEAARQAVADGQVAHRCKSDRHDLEIAMLREQVDQAWRSSRKATGVLAVCIVQLCLLVAVLVFA